MPLEFVDSIKEKHIALFYEDPEYARLVEFRFLRNGLDLGEHCVYATAQDSGSIVLKMLEYGIPLKYFLDGRIRVYQTHRVCGGEREMMDNCKKDLALITSNLKSPFRIVTRIVHDISTITGMSIELELERSIHQNFKSFGGSLICPYGVQDIESEKRKYWLKELYANHHAVIHATRFGELQVLG